MEWIFWALYTYPTIGFMVVMTSGAVVAGPLLWLMFSKYDNLLSRILRWSPALTLLVAVTCGISVSLSGLLNIYASDEYIPNPRQCEQAWVIRNDIYHSEFTFPENKFFESGPLLNDDSTKTLTYQVTFCRNRVDYATAEYGPWYYEGAEFYNTKTGDKTTTRLPWFERKVTMKNPS